MISCIIVEDEPLAVARLETYIGKLRFLELCGVFDNGIDALAFLKQQNIDLVFLDINIGELSGIQLLEASAIKSKVIITTAYHEYALKGFELKVTDYLLKPFTFDRFVNAVEKVREEQQLKESTKNKDFIFIKTEYRLEKVLLQDILFIEGMRDYRRIHTTAKKIMTLQTFRDFEQMIPSSVICRVHKSYMVALGKIDTIEKDHLTIGARIIPVSDTYKKLLVRLIS